MVDELCGHEDGPLFLVNINNNLASAGYDCEVLTWSLSDIDKRVWEKTQMEKEDLLSRKHDAWYNSMFKKKIKKSIKK